MQLSEIGRSIKQSATLKLNQTAALLKSQGEPIIHLGGGEPKTKAPIDAIIKASAMINNAEVRYSPADGIPEAKQAAIKYTQDNYGFTPQMNNVLISVGAKQALFFALQSILNPGDEVLFPSPFWVSYTEMAKMLGASAKAVIPKDGSFFPTIDDISSNISPNTKAIIINSPNNPTGVIYKADFIAQIVDFCEKKGLWLILDDIYHKLYFDNQKPTNAFEYTKFHEKSNIIIIQGVSKLYAMTGFRIGWAIANSEVISIMKNLQAHTNSAPSPITQTAAAGAILGCQTTVESLRQTLENNRNIMYDRLISLDGVKITKPNGTFYMFADFRHFEKDSVKLATFLLETVKVAAMPGIEFGMEGFLRLSYNTTTKEIIEGIDRIKWALDPNSPKETFIGGRKTIKNWL